MRLVKQGYGKEGKKSSIRLLEVLHAFMVHTVSEKDNTEPYNLSM